jgi:hypothetical protein
VLEHHADAEAPRVGGRGDRDGLAFPAIFISVDLPAPFSPRSAWISPGITARSMSAFATTEG